MPDNWSYVLAAYVLAALALAGYGRHLSRRVKALRKRSPVKDPKTA